MNEYRLTRQIQNYSRAVATGRVRTRNWYVCQQAIRAYAQGAQAQYDLFRRVRQCLECESSPVVLTAALNFASQVGKLCRRSRNAAERQQRLTATVERWQRWGLDAVVMRRILTQVFGISLPAS